jgi:23S rRNA G2445 N2-methylase RlmL
MGSAVEREDAQAVPDVRTGTPITVLARCLRGLEPVAADEITATLPAASRLAVSEREISFQLPGPDPAVLGLRCVDDLFLQVGPVEGVGPGKEAVPIVARAASALPWQPAIEAVRALRELPAGPRFDVVAGLEGQRRFNRFELEHAVGAVVAGPLHGSYLPRTAQGGPSGDGDITVRVFVRGERALFGLRIARRPLHRREYKQDTGKGTLHPPLAAALWRLTGAPAGSAVADPFCGDGTIPIEVALAAPVARVRGGDLDPERLENARRNAARAGVQIDFARADAGRLRWDERSVDVLVTNPPWNVAVSGAGSLRGSLRGFWSGAQRVLTDRGRLCVLADAELQISQQLRDLGFQSSIDTRIRVAGRLSQVLLCAPPGQRAPRPPAGVLTWRSRALAAGVITEDGF